MEEEYFFGKTSDIILIYKKKNLYMHHFCVKDIDF